VASARETTSYAVDPVQRQQVSLLAVLRRRVLIIVGTALLCGAAAAAFAYANRDTYESTAKLLFRQTLGPEATALGLQPASVDVDRLAKDSAELVGSRRVAVETARELRRRGSDISADDVADDVAVAGADDSEVVEVTAEADSAERAALLANVYARSARRLIRRDDRKQTLRALQSVRQQLAEERARQAGPPASRRNATDRLSSHA
jgi:capsular polysaccharide biosynthesis protein